MRPKMYLNQIHYNLCCIGTVYIYTAYDAPRNTKYIMRINICSVCKIDNMYFRFIQYYWFNFFFQCKHAGVHIIEVVILYLLTQYLKKEFCIIFNFQTSIELFVITKELVRLLFPKF